METAPNMRHVFAGEAFLHQAGTIIISINIIIMTEIKRRPCNGEKE